LKGYGAETTNTEIFPDFWYLWQILDYLHQNYATTEIVNALVYTMPEIEQPAEELVENTTTEFLHPKAGTYGETTGTWTFRKAGTKRTLKAKISDKDFLSKFERGTIRFYQGDLLKVELAERQKVRGTKATVENEIIAVLEYRKAPPTAATNGRTRR